VLDSEGGLRTLFVARVPGTIPPHVNPPRPVDPATGVAAGTPPAANPPASRGGLYGLASAESKPAPQAAGRPVAADSGNIFTRLFSSDGDSAHTAQGGPTGSLAQKPPSPARTAARPEPKPAQLAKTKPAPSAPAASAAFQAEPKAPPPPQPQYAAAKPLPAPVDPAARAPAPGTDASLLSSQPMAPVGSFESRWGTGR
jgi:hypothetical protein